MARLTKRQALLNCIEMWEWLAKAPKGTLKTDFPAFSDSKSKHFNVTCWACAYTHSLKDVKEGKVSSCSKCPVQWIASDVEGTNGCYHTVSPYNIWATKKTKANAKAVLNVIKQSLANLKR